jgi:hypothetical protein
MKKGTKKKVEKKIIDFSPQVEQNDLLRNSLITLLKNKVPKLFDRDPQGYSIARLNSLVDEIIGLLKK